MAQTSNDCKGITYVSNDSGQLLFRRPEMTATGLLTQTGVVTTAVAGWNTGVQGAANALDLYKTIASGTGVVTLSTGSTTATTGGAV